MSVLYFWVNGGGTVVKYNWSNVVAVIGGGAAPFSFSYRWVHFFTRKGRIMRDLVTFGQAEL